MTTMRGIDALTGRLVAVARRDLELVVALRCYLLRSRCEHEKGGRFLGLETRPRMESEWEPHRKSK